MQQQPSGSGSSTGLTDNMASALCYLPVIALVFLFVAPYNANRTVRFHAFQSLFLTAAVIVANIVLSIIQSSFYSLGLYALIGLASMLFSLAVLALYIILAVKAYQGQTMELPVISQLARQQAGA